MKLKVVLIETASRGQKGSMSGYADLVVHAFSTSNYAAKLQLKRVCLAPPLFLSARLPFRFRSWLHHVWVTCAAMSRLAGQKADVFHIVDGSQAHIARWLPNAPVVATAHDFIPLLQTKGQLLTKRPGSMARWIIEKSINELKKLNLVIADSNNTKKDFIYSAGGDIGKVLVVHPAIPICMVKEAASDFNTPWPDRRRSGRAYILHVGNNGFYKNRTGVLKIFSRIRRKLGVELKMVGPQPSVEISNLARELGITEHVHFVVDPDDGQILEMYNKAALLLFPSLYEGFGFPPLEAMVCGCPVVCSSEGSLPEVVGDAALKCTAGNVDQMAENCIAVLEDAGLAEGLIQKGHLQAKKFSLERMGKGLMKVYMEAVNQKSEG